MRATDGTIRLPKTCFDRERFVRSIVIASLIAAVLTAAFLLSRRVAGAFSTDLPAQQLIATAAIMLIWGIAVRELTSRDPLIVSIVLTTILLLALGCSYPGARVIDWLCWPAALFGIVLCPPIIRSRKRLSPATQPKIIDRIDNTEPGETLLQNLCRVRLNDGSEAIRGELVAEFAAGERQATLYVAFCPPFERLPHIEVNVADDSDVTVKVTLFLHNGTQLEVRLPKLAEEPTSVTIELYAAENA